MAASGEIYWPPTGISNWPLTLARPECNKSLYGVSTGPA